MDIEEKKMVRSLSRTGKRSFPYVYLLPILPLCLGLIASADLLNLIYHISLQNCTVSTFKTARAASSLEECRAIPFDSIDLFVCVNSLALFKCHIVVLMWTDMLDVLVSLNICKGLDTPGRNRPLLVQFP